MFMEAFYGQESYFLCYCVIGTGNIGLIEACFKVEIRNIHGNFELLVTISVSIHHQQTGTKEI